MLSVLGLTGSPRRGGNTDLLLERVLSGAESRGAATETIFIAQLNIRPCQHCDGCLHTGVCVIDDDMQPIHERLRAVDRLVLASPIFFMTVTAQTKTVIDRCQALWVAKYLLKVRHPTASDGSPRRGLFVSVGGTGHPRLFEPAIVTVKAFFATCDVLYGGELVFPRIDEAGAIRKHSSALDDAFAAGVRLVEGEQTPPSKDQ